MDAATRRGPRGQSGRVACALLLCAASAVLPRVHAQDEDAAPRPSAAVTNSLSRVVKDATAAPITYVTSEPNSPTLVWWAAFLLVVGALGVLAACVLPIYHLCKGRMLRAEEVARGAEINKSMQEMTARLYRTRQLQQHQHQYEARMAASSSSIDVDAGEHTGGRRGSEEEMVSVLFKDAVDAASKPTGRNTAFVSVLPLNDASHEEPSAPMSVSRDTQRGDASITDSAVAPLRKKRSVLTRDELRNGGGLQRHGSTDAAQLERGVSQTSFVSSSASASHLNRHTSAATLAQRSTSSRSLRPSPSPGQLSRAPSVRAFAGMNRVEALRRALGAPQLHPVAPTHDVSHSHSPGLKRQQSINFVLSGAFESDNGRQQSREDDVHRGSPFAHSLGSGDVVQHSHSGTMVAGGETASYAAVSSSQQTPPQPPPRSPTAITANNAFTQAAEDSLKDAAVRGEDSTGNNPLDSNANTTSAANSLEATCAQADTTMTHRLTMDRITSEMQRLLKPAPSPVYADACAAPTPLPATSTTSEEKHTKLTDLGDEAATRLPGPMEGNGFFTLVPVLSISDSDSDDGGDDTNENEHNYIRHNSYGGVRGEEEGCSKLSHSTRFVLARSVTDDEGRRVVGRPVTVSNAFRDGEADECPNSSMKGEAENDGQKSLSSTRRAQADWQRTVPASASSRRKATGSYQANNLNQSDEYSKLMDTQFQMEL